MSVKEPYLPQKFKKGGEYFRKSKELSLPLNSKGRGVFQKE